MALDPVKTVTGTAVYVPGDDIDTDRIIPARYLRCVTFDGLGEHLFRDVRYEGDDLHGRHPIDQPEHTGASILISDSNFGCGSSREHAPQAIYRFGFRAVIAESFAEIFFGNSTTLGMPCVTLEEDDIRQLTEAVAATPGLQVHIDLEDMKVRAGDLEFSCGMDESARRALLNGHWDPIADLLEGGSALDELEAGLPYL
ncbi:MAG TPA: 3-isopropylmalate dehydratase small subunit [Deinococcales bacterium]|nr:3-isopropylmalate dehydratase small subunit [Deinococcales bacterium]